MNAPDERADQAQLLRVAEEFLALLNDLVGAFAWAGIGIGRAQDMVLKEVLPKATNVDAHFLIGRGAPDDDDAVAFHRWPQKDLSDHLSAGGLVMRLLGRQWLVAVYSYWEDHYRELFAEALGIEKDALKDDLMGDIGLLRNDIVHHRAIASRRNCGRCKKLGHWVEVGKEIVIDNDMVIEFTRHAGLAFHPGGKELPPLD